jgi:hypothetical protein
MTKDFIYDLLDGLDKNNQDYILLIPTNTATEDEDDRLCIESFYKVERKDNDGVKAIIASLQVLGEKLVDIAEENGIDLEELGYIDYDDDEGEDEDEDEYKDGY